MGNSGHGSVDPDRYVKRIRAEEVFGDFLNRLNERQRTEFQKKTGTRLPVRYSLVSANVLYPLLGEAYRAALVSLDDAGIELGNLTPQHPGAYTGIHRACEISVTVRSGDVNVDDETVRMAFELHPFTRKPEGNLMDRVNLFYSDEEIPYGLSEIHILGSSGAKALGDHITTTISKSNPLDLAERVHQRVISTDNVNSVLREMYGPEKRYVKLLERAPLGPTGTGGR